VRAVGLGDTAVKVVVGASAAAERVGRGGGRLPPARRRVAKEGERRRGASRGRGRGRLSWSITEILAKPAATSAPSTSAAAVAVAAGAAIGAAAAAAAEAVTEAEVYAGLGRCYYRERGRVLEFGV